MMKNKSKHIKLIGINNKKKYLQNKEVKLNSYLRILIVLSIF